MLRKHQKNGFDMAIKHYIKNNKFRLNMTTGTGKTVIAIYIGDELYEKYKVVATHTNVLKDQFQKEVNKWAKDPSTWLVETYQTLRSMNIRCDFLIVDEVHQGGQTSEGSYKTIIDTLKPRKILSLSATDYKVDEELFGKAKFSYGLEEASKDKTINEVKIITIDTGLKQILSSGKEITAEELAHVYDEDVKHGVDLKHQKTIEAVLTNNVRCALKEYKKKEKTQAIMFIHSKEWAEKAFSMANKMGLSTQYVHSGLSKEDVSSLISGFKCGAFKLLICVRMLQEGFDFPSLEVIIDCAPSFTNEGRMFKQRMGRGTRKVKGKSATRYYIINHINKFSNDLDVHDSLMANIEVVSRNDLRDNKYTNREINIPIGVISGNTRTYSMFVEHTEGYVAGKARNLFELVNRQDSSSKKQILFEMAKKGDKKPKWGSRLSQALSSYTVRSSGAFDPIFTIEIEKLGWVGQEREAEKTKKEILQIAKKYPLEKMKDKHPLYNRLCGYLKRDEDFRNALINIAPQWFSKKVSFKEKVIKFAGMYKDIYQCLSSRERAGLRSLIKRDNKFLKSIKKINKNFIPRVTKDLINKSKDLSFKKTLKRRKDLGVQKTKNGKWMPSIWDGEKSIYLGVRETKREAIEARKEAELKYWK